MTVGIFASACSRRSRMTEGPLRASGRDALDGPSRASIAYSRDVFDGRVTVLRRTSVAG